MIARLFPVLAAALFLAAVPARAGLFDDDEARKRIEETNKRLTQAQTELDARLNALEQQLRSKGLVDLFNQVEQIRADVAKLRGQLEVLAYEQEQQQKRQRDLYVDLDTRLRKLESAGAAGAPAPSPAAGGVAVGTGPFAATAGGSPTVAVAPPTGAPPAISADAVVEQRAYDAALDQFKRGDYAGSVAAFSAFVKTWPKSPLAPSAQYWVGNAQYARKDYRAAIAAQRALIQQYPDSQKVPDALLNIASAQGELGEAPAAKRTFDELTAKYPHSDAAAKARQRGGR